MKAMVIEDSRLAREGLIRLLEPFAEIELIGAADHPETALPMIEQSKPELLFLDIHMPGASGFELLDQIGYSPRVIFTTAFQEHAIRSFDYHTVDYLLKPISPERLAQAIAKLVPGGETLPAAGETRLERNSRILLFDDRKSHLVPLQSISHIESCKNYVIVYFGEHRAFVKRTLSSLEARLPKEDFLRISRQTLVNLMHISGMEEHINLTLTLTMANGKKIEMSRRQAAMLRDRLSL